MGLTHLRRAKEKEAPERNEWVRSAMKRMISLAMRTEEKIITAKELTAAKKLHTTLKKLSGRLVRQLMAQFEQELSHAKAEREHRVEQQDTKLRKLMVAIDRIGSHVNSGAALKKLQKEVKAMENKEGLTHLRRAKEKEAPERNDQFGNEKRGKDNNSEGIDSCKKASYHTEKVVGQIGETVDGSIRARVVTC